MDRDRRCDFLLRAGGATVVIAGGLAASAGAAEKATAGGKKKGKALFGKEGIVVQVAKLVQALGIYELDQFTPRG
jgi:hypothetical protein